MALVSLKVNVDVRCPACDVTVPVAGLLEKLPCPGCGQVIVLGRLFLKGLLRDAIQHVSRQGARAIKGVCSGGESLTPGPLDLRQWVHYSVAAPRCAACATELPLYSLESALAEGRGAVACVACGAPTALSRPAELGFLLHPKVLALAGEHRPGPRFGDRGVAIWCLGCGAATALDAYHGLVRCGTCEESFTVDQGTWERTVAIPGFLAFYVLVRAPEPKQKPATPTAPLLFPLSLGWVFMTRVGIPFALWLSGLAAAVKYRLGAHGSGEVLAVLLLFVLVRLGIFVHMALRDRDLRLGPDTLHVPVHRPWQLRSWDLPLDEIQGVSEQRRRGWTSRIVVVMRDGPTRDITINCLRDGRGLLRALEERLDDRSRVTASP